jgi:hypothetical protein
MSKNSEPKYPGEPYTTDTMGRRHYYDPNRAHHPHVTHPPLIAKEVKPRHLRAHHLRPHRTRKRRA